MFKELFSIEETDFRYDLAEKLFQHPYPHRSNYPKFQKVIEERVNGLSREDIAAGIQYISEQVVSKFVAAAVKDFGRVDLRTAGGVFANVRINQKVAELDSVKSMYIFPAMGDGGLCSGAALY